MFPKQKKIQATKKQTQQKNPTKTDNLEMVWISYLNQMRLKKHNIFFHVNMN